MVDRKPSYDSKCYDLALHFLQDAGLEPTAKAAAADLMAQEFQQIAEDWADASSIIARVTSGRAPLKSRAAMEGKS